MNVGIVEAVLLNIAAQIADVIGILQPYGEKIARDVMTIGIVMIGLSVATGGNYLSSIARFTGVSAIVMYAIRGWDDIVMRTVTGSRDVIGLLLGSNYTGPTMLFEAAATIVNRVMAEPAAWGWSLSGTLGAIAQDFLIALCGVLIAIGLSFPGILSILAEIHLLIGCALAPLLLGFLAFPVTAPIGWGCINFLLAGSVRLIVLGLISVVFGNAIESVIDLPGPDATMTFSAVLGLTLTSLMAVVTAIGGNNVATSLVGNGLGTLGWSSVTHASSVATGAVSSVANIGGAAVSAGAAAAKSGGAAAGAGIGAAGRGAAQIARSVGSGGRSAFS